ncbi:hypothetical protein AALA24_13680 [Anaerovoracaceae bacterium 42-11]
MNKKSFLMGTITITMAVIVCMAFFLHNAVNDFELNEYGESYGAVDISNASLEKAPDLIAVVSTDGEHGYVKKFDLFSEAPLSPNEALANQEAHMGEYKSISVYKKDGKTVIGEFLLGR